MERLTYRDGEGNAHTKRNTSYIDILEKLAEYEDLEEQGLLLQLPCNVSSTVYRICPQSKHIKFGDMWDGKKVERPCQRCPWRGCECHNIGFQKDMDNIVREVKAIDLSWIIRRKDYFGSIYFLTELEAQATLDKMMAGGAQEEKEQ